MGASGWLGYANTCQAVSCKLFMFQLLFILLYWARLCPVTFSVGMRRQTSDLMVIERSERHSPALCLNFTEVVQQRCNKILWWISYKMSLKIEREREREREIRVRFPVEFRRYSIFTLLHRDWTTWQSLYLFRWSGVKISANCYEWLLYLFLIFSRQILRKIP
jgi:hypothetical protein